MYKGEKRTGKYHRITISGDLLHEVPVKVPRKKLEPRLQVKDTAVTGITVKHIGIGNYYGFTLDGNNRYLLGDFTVTHNTCSAIAIASTSWETDGYTILYVTRHTLKADVYKNMFRQVCSQTIKRDIIKEEIDIPDGKIQSPSRLLPNKWMQPISFKQFSNACLKKNDIYRELKKRNGEADPFKKTLIVIDEAHKLYATDVVGSERPDIEAITNAIQNSYKVSGKDSARLLLMTATPFTTNPFDLIKLVNLMKEENEQIPVSFDKFYEDYLSADGTFSTAGKRFFANDVSGYISYLNRSNDARQFAYPIFHQELVPMSRSKNDKQKEELLKLLKRIYQLNFEIKKSKDDIRQVKETFRERINEAKEECKELPKPERKDCELENVEPLKEQAEEAVNNIKERAENKKDELQRVQSLSKKMTDDIKNAAKNDLSQEFVLNNKCKLPIHSTSKSHSSMEE